MDGDSCLSAEYRLMAVAHTDGLDHTGDLYCYIALNSPRKFAVPWDDPVKRLICARAGRQNRRSVCSGENSRRGELSAGFPCFYPGGRLRWHFLRRICANSGRSKEENGMSKLEKRIHDAKNGLDYVLVGDCYIPALIFPEESRPIGK